MKQSKKHFVIFILIFLVVIGAVAFYQLFKKDINYFLVQRYASQKESSYALSSLERALEADTDRELPQIFEDVSLKNIWNTCEIVDLQKKYQEQGELKEQEEYIHKMHNTIRIYPSKIEYEEEIYYVFGCTPSHGIFRYIPGKCSASDTPTSEELENNNTLVHFLSVTDIDEKKYTTKIYDDENRCVNRIGTEAVKFQGVKFYHIQYDSYSKDVVMNDSILIGISGNWQYPVKSFSADVQLASAMNIASIQCAFATKGADLCKVDQDGNTLHISYDGIIQAKEVLFLKVMLGEAGSGTTLDENLEDDDSIELTDTSDTHTFIYPNSVLKSWSDNYDETKFEVVAEMQDVQQHFEEHFDSLSMTKISDTEVNDDCQSSWGGVFKNDTSSLRIRLCEQENVSYNIQIKKGSMGDFIPNMKDYPSRCMKDISVSLSNASFKSGSGDLSFNIHNNGNFSVKHFDYVIYEKDEKTSGSTQKKITPHLSELVEIKYKEEEIESFPDKIVITPRRVVTGINCNYDSAEISDIANLRDAENTDVDTNTGTGTDTNKEGGDE